MADNNITNYKQSVEKNIEEVLEALNSLTTLSNNDGQRENLREILNSITEIAFHGINRMNLTLSSFKKNAEWDTFNIAFFGETNAGKSTLIEALIKGDGRSIGEGYKDNTKRLSKYHLGERKISLLDMPGIEGKERQFIEEIKKAVEKAHVVFYVLEPKEPEEGTLSKIKSYLKDRAKVISLINCRGKPKLYALKQHKLVDDNIEVIAKNTREKFLRVIGNNYHSNIILNAYIGFLSVGKPVRKDFLEDRKKAKNVFKTLEQAYSFSNLKELEETIDNLYHSSIYEIVVSNTYKVLREIEKILSEILTNKKDYDLGINDVSKQAEETFSEVWNLIEKYEKRVTQQIELKIEMLKNQLTKKVYEGIENKWRKDYLNEQIKKIETQCKNELNETIEQQRHEMEQEINSLFEKFKKRMSLSTMTLDLKGQIDIDSILKELKIGLKYLMQQAVDIGSSIITIIANPVRGIIMTVPVAIRKIWEWCFEDPSKRQSEAKKRARDEIETSVNKIKISAFQSMRKKIRESKWRMESLKTDLNSYIKHIKSISRNMDNIISKIKSVQADISLELAKFVIGDGIIFSYIDLNLREMLIVGTYSDVNTDLFRVKVRKYTSVQSLFADIDSRLEKETLILNNNDEFIYRALNMALIANPNILGVKRVRRQKND